MKIVGDIQVLKESSTVLMIDQPIAGTMRLLPQTTLDAMVIVPRPDLPKGIRKMTLIATPLPEAAWGSLIRMSATLTPAPGSLERIVAALQNLGIFCRHIETINGVNLKGTQVYGPDRRAWRFGSNQDDLIIPSTLFVLEVQSEHRRVDDDSPGFTEYESDAQDLHRSLRSMISANQRNRSRSPREVVAKMETLLRKHAGPLEVDWISPMSTLNRLDRRLDPHKKDSPHQRFSQRLLVSKSLQLDLSSLRHVLWDLNLRVPYPTFSGSQTSLFVQGFADSDEQVMCWDFYQFYDDLVVQFDITTPTAGVEQRWWEWIYSSIRGASGNILASASSARIDGQWGTLKNTVVFPFDENSDDIARIIYCFRTLQGDCGHTPEFETLKRNIADDCKNNGRISNLDLGREKEPSFSSILQNVDVWDPSDGAPIRPYFQRFAPNPFNFTLPLDLYRYHRLYGENFTEQQGPDGNEASLRNRHRLAKRIIERVSGNPGENIALVGAHRAGKTTVLNLVEDTLLETLYMEDPTSSQILIPVRLNAAVDHPEAFLRSLTVKLEKILATFESNPELARTTTRMDTIKKLLSSIGRNALPVVAALEVGISEAFGIPEGFPSLAVDLGLLLSALESRTKEKPATNPDAQDQALRGSSNAEHETSELLRISLLHLRGVLATLERENRDVKICVIIDEFSEAARWGRPEAFPVLRHVIESRDFSRIKWLVSASRPVIEATDYSPITNALFEYNVGPLPLEESQRMIDAFGASRWQKDARERNGETQDGLLEPVIMHQARLFLLEATSQLAYLLQVSCYHIYDRATRTYVPLVGRTLCIRIILDKVLPELSDYFATQWKKIHPDAQRLIRESLKPFADPLTGQRNFLRNMEAWKDDINAMPSGFRKALERSGLRGEDTHSVAPLVACWLLTAAE